MIYQCLDFVNRVRINLVSFFKTSLDGYKIVIRFCSRVTSMEVNDKVLAHLSRNRLYPSSDIEMLSLGIRSIR